MKKSDTFHAIGLSIITILIVIFYFSYLNDLNEKLKYDFKVPFNNSDSIELNSGPIWFFYDKNKHTISSAKPISLENKLTLLSLYPKEKSLSPSYSAAVDELTYISNKEIGDIFSLILILGGLGGMLGVMIRSLSSLIFHASQKTLDMATWWPWYYLRPTMGLGIGITIVVLSKTKLLVIDSPGELTGFWILGICILSGFAISEVTDRLYYSANTLFGGKNS